MKGAVFCLILCGLALLNGCAVAPTTAPPAILRGTPEQPLVLSGVLQQDQYLAGEIRVDSDLLVPCGRRLVIGPGSRVRVVGTDSTKIDPEYLDKGTEILVRGRIELAGTMAAPIRFERDPATPKGENWSGLELVTAEGALLRHVDIIGAETALLLDDSSAELEAVNLLGARYGLLVQGESRLHYQGGRISGGDAGLLCFDLGTLDLGPLQILDNAEEGLYLAAGCRLSQQGLQIARNDLGLVALPAAGAALSTVVRDNRVDFQPLPQPEAP